MSESFDVTASAGAFGAVGAAVSSLNEVVPALLVFPAASVAVAITEIVPSPSVVRSPSVSFTTTAVRPLPVKSLVTDPPFVRLKVTVPLAPLSAFTVTTPPDCVASA